MVGRGFLTYKIGFVPDKSSTGLTVGFFSHRGLNTYAHVFGWPLFRIRHVCSGVGKYRLKLRWKRHQATRVSLEEAVTVYNLLESGVGILLFHACFPRLAC